MDPPLLHRTPLPPSLILLISQQAFFVSTKPEWTANINKQTYACVIRCIMYYVVILLPLEIGCFMISIITLYELTKTRLEPGICGLMASTNFLNLALNMWAASFNVRMQPSSVGTLALAIGLQPLGFIAINTNLLASKLYNLCMSFESAVISLISKYYVMHGFLWCLKCKKLKIQLIQEPWTILLEARRGLLHPSPYQNSVFRLRSPWVG